MLLLLLVFLMKFVDISLLNRPRHRCGGTINSLSSGSGSSNGTDSNSSSKENICTTNTITPQQYQQLRYYQRLQQQQLVLLQRELLKRQLLKQCQQKISQRLNGGGGATSEGVLKEKRGLNNENANYAGPGGKGPKSRRGMTEFSSQNESHKSHLPQLNHNSPHHHHQQHTQPPYKRPLTSPNTPFNHCYGFPSFNPSSNNQHHHHQQQQQYQPPYSNGYLNPPPPPPYVRDLINDDELTDESLKKNVQIVLNNLDRYNNALRSIILNDQINSLSFNNNNSSSAASSLGMAGNNMVTTPESDYNSNATQPHNNLPYGMGIGYNAMQGGHLNCSIASSHDFSHDSDYQWFLDYGYRDGMPHQSVLSSLCESYNGIGELSYYEDLAKNLDANLAEVDMESFRAEDIHSFLTQIPSYCKDKQQQLQQQHSTEIDNSICKSELLFSPVKESHISIDSLDLESYPDDGDIILTCKGNKDNYTIAFEGSVLYSDESFYAEPNEIQAKNKQNCINLHSNLDDIVKRKSLEVSMCRSDNAFTTWSKLKKNSTSHLQRYPSGNNNITSVNIVTRHATNCSVRKSSSLPNLILKKEVYQQLNVSQALSTSTVDSCKLRNLLPMCHMPISSTSGSESPAHTTPSCSHHTSNMQSTDSTSNKHSVNQPAFNLVKLFIKQKSSSSETCMDVSSGCWPSSDGSSSSVERDRHRKKSMNDSGKGSALSRHDEEDDDDAASYQLDSLDICDKTDTTMASPNVTPKKVKADLYREVFETPQRRVAMKNPQVLNLTAGNNNNNNNNSDCAQKSFSSEASRTSENLTQVFCPTVPNNRMKIPVDMITRSIQTSALLKDRLKFVPPSFLAKLNKLGEEKPAPVYVIYPNYALPDLGFVKTNATTDVIFSPFNYKTAVGVPPKRPGSFTTRDEEQALRNIDLKKVADLKSLMTLLPIDYRKRLQKHIPEADVELDSECSMRPLFCMTPPLRRNAKTKVCDCAQYFQQQTAACTSSSGSGSSQPPSSGYHGSSTLLTGSEFDTQPQSDPMKNMYVYQYDNNTRMEAGGETLHEKPPRTPRGILRRNLNRPSSRTKRNSMYEEQNSNVRNLDKRRSLQEPYYNMSEDDILVEEVEEDKMRQYYDELHTNMKLERTDVNFMMELDRKSRKDRDLEARARAENFLCNVPKSELKFYAEIANILESTDSPTVQYDAVKLKNEVSRALSQKKVSFNQKAEMDNVGGIPANLSHRFSTPPNSPNISIATLQNLPSDQRIGIEKDVIESAEKAKLDKISTNRFKRLQIQWELMSKDSCDMLKDLASEKETKSGGSTPTSANAPRSRIPRPVSYPASNGNSPNVKQDKISLLRTNFHDARTQRSPSRIVQPKRYSVPTPSPAVSTAPSTTTSTAVRARTPNSRTNANNSNTSTPKRRVQSPRTVTRTR